MTEFSFFIDIGLNLFSETVGAVSYGIGVGGASNTFRSQNLTKFTIGSLDSVQHERAQALHEGERDPAEQVVEGGPLLLPCLHGDAPGQPPQLVYRRGVEPPEGLGHHRDEGDALAPAELAVDLFPA